MRLNVWGWRCRVGAAFRSGRGLHGECVAEYQRHLAGQHGRQARSRAFVGNLAQWDAKETGRAPRMRRELATLIDGSVLREELDY